MDGYSGMNFATIGYSDDMMTILNPTQKTANNLETDSWLFKIVNHRNHDSFASRLRRSRFKLFLSLIQPFPKPVRILDIGGEQNYWEMMGFSSKDECLVVLLNKENQIVSKENFIAFRGDAGRLSRADIQMDFDVIFCNSVIEHLGCLKRQTSLANFIRSFETSYYVQTPNKSFPIEPHFLVPFYQYFPVRLQIFLHQKFHLGWYRRQPDYRQAARHILSHRLIQLKEMESLFPDGIVFRERFLGMTKSFIAIRLVSNYQRRV